MDHQQRIDGIAAGHQSLASEIQSLLGNLLSQDIGARSLKRSPVYFAGLMSRVAAMDRSIQEFAKESRPGTQEHLNVVSDRLKEECKALEEAPLSDFQMQYIARRFGLPLRDQEPCKFVARTNR